MKNTKIYAAIGISILALSLTYTAMASEEKESKAVEAAKAWVELIDKGKYDESWVTAAVYFKNAITKKNGNKY